MLLSKEIYHREMSQENESENKDNDDEHDEGVFICGPSSLQANKTLSEVILLKEYRKAKEKLPKCVDFVMTKSNYRKIKGVEQFDIIKHKLETIDNKLTEIKMNLTEGSMDRTVACLNNQRWKLLNTFAELDALVQKLSAIVR